MTISQDTRTIRVCLQEMSVPEANKASKELEILLKRLVGPDGSVDIEKDPNSNTMDMGATIVIVLGTPFALAVAKGIRDFIAKYGNRIVIDTPGGTLIATGDAVHNLDVAKTVEAITRLH